jgi:starch synthase
MPPEDKNPEESKTPRKRPSKKTQAEPSARAARAKPAKAAGAAPPQPRARKPRAQKPRSDSPVSRNSLSVLIVASEAHPFAKTGGLAEVTAALSDALARLGHQVTLALPRYRGTDVKGAERLDTRLRFGSRLQPVTILEQRLQSGATAALIDVPELFDRDALYGTSAGDYADNAWRFAVLSRAALEYPRLRKWRPSIIHAHDWQAGLVPVYQKMDLSDDPFVGGVPAVFTLHNLAFQGIFPAATLADIGLGHEVMNVQALEFWGNVSYLKGGINFSEKITTVSPTYAREIVQPELGFGFEGVLARRADDLVGIVNGIDTARWSPAADPYVKASFSADNLTGKRDAKRELLAAARLPSDDAALSKPVIGLVSRLTDQKGFDLIASALDDLMALDAQWVMLGNGESRYEALWRYVASRHPTRVSTTIGFNERMAHQIEAGADMFLMPSRFEPCGLNQLYSLRYGTVPIVRATGGLEDTVVDAMDAMNDGKGTGFKFRDYTPEALVEAVQRALATYRDRETWEGLQKRGMREDHSWDVSAAEYVKLYEGLARVHGFTGSQVPGNQRTQEPENP